MIFSAKSCRLFRQSMLLQRRFCPYESRLFYPNKKATSRPSRLRWRYRFSDFVDKTLALLSNSPRIKKCSLRCDYEKDETSINRWIRNVLERGCLELNLESRYALSIDSQFFTSNTLVELTVSYGFHPLGRLNSSWVFVFPSPQDTYYPFSIVSNS
ncbi:hypothetical protein CARUB_v10007722mg [Capsella rubella]|uniref:Uncharacterized protein n=1 Tax=Capsella rubella TaxID=81985 RepID=R0FAM6_9BRAS|nr:hypothetical protein CARUB_v10007722mg [Capsella rubella]